MRDPRSRDLLRGVSAFTFAAQHFHAMAMSKESIKLFLKEITTTPESLADRIKQRDYGSNDFTELRKRPLILASAGYLPFDILFLVEKFESGPYWMVNNINKSVGDRLRRFWGAVFEAYMNGFAPRNKSRIRRGSDKTRQPRTTNMRWSHNAG
jgi:hypothetical protein